jgi:hypothetical protein
MEFPGWPPAKSAKFPTSWHAGEDNDDVYENQVNDKTAENTFLYLYARGGSSEGQQR